MQTISERSPPCLGRSLQKEERAVAAPARVKTTNRSARTSRGRHRDEWADVYNFRPDRLAQSIRGSPSTFGDSVQRSTSR